MSLILIFARCVLLFLREFSYNMFKDCYSYEMMGYRDTLEHEFLLPFMEKFGLR